MTQSYPPRHAQAAAIVRAQISDGTLRPGHPAPSSARLARLTGFSEVTCRRALRTLIAEGILVAGPSARARPRIAAPAGTGTTSDAAARALSRALSAMRRASGLTQPELAALTGYATTTIGHAETGRLWQSRDFWEKTDLTLAADGQLTRLHDAYRAAAGTPGNPVPPPAEPGPARLPLSVSVVITWDDGTVTTVRPAAAEPPAAG